MAVEGSVIRRFNLEQCLINSSVPKEVVMPVGAEIVGASIVRSAPVLWTVVDPEEASTQDRYFLLYGEERPFDVGDDGATFSHVATVQLQNVFWHIVEVTY